MPKMHQNTLAAGLRPDPLGERMRSPRPPSRRGGHTSKENKGRGAGPTPKGTGGKKGGEGHWKGRGRKYPAPPKVKASRIDTAV